VEFIGGPKDGERHESTAPYGVGDELHFASSESGAAIYRYSVQERADGTQYLLYAGRQSA